MRINNPGYSNLAPVGKIERELFSFLVGKIGAEECAGPSPSAFGNGNDNGVGAGKLASAAAEIPSHDTSNLFASGLRSSGSVARVVYVITSPAVSPSVSQLVCCALPRI